MRQPPGTCIFATDSSKRRFGVLTGHVTGSVGDEISSLVHRFFLSSGEEAMDAINQFDQNQFDQSHTKQQDPKVFEMKYD